MLLWACFYTALCPERCMSIGVLNVPVERVSLPWLSLALPPVPSSSPGSPLTLCPVLRRC